MLSRLFLLKNKKCCGEGCLMCPYEPKHCQNSEKIRTEVLEICSKEELDIIDETSIKKL
jgi:hypothetical protein|tara:strand:- start:2 stop:178 length:177 start_codon:yes stop_codon:yes gene_type:complete